MSGNKPPPSKPQSGPVIRSSPPPSLDERVTTIEQFLKEQFDERNQWNAVLRGWIGQKVRVRLMDGASVEGVLNWVDRYTICLGVTDIEIVHKGAIATIKKV